MTAPIIYWCSALYLTSLPLGQRARIYQQAVEVAPDTFPDLRSVVRYVARQRLHPDPWFRVETWCDAQRRKESRRWRWVQAQVPAGPCTYCGALDARTLDHVLPRSRGGSHALSNLVRACRSCNSRKCNRTPAEFLTWLEAGRPPAVVTSLVPDLSPLTPTQRESLATRLHELHATRRHELHGELHD